MHQIDTFLSNCKNHLLSKLVLCSILNVGCIFDYQASLFKAEQSLETIAMSLVDIPEFSCKEVTEFISSSCFKHGAAFDKMGYYSILVNVFLLLHYSGLVNNVDDAISLCIYFGFMCNGTSAFVAIWTHLCTKLQLSFGYYTKQKSSLKLLGLLV